MPLKNLGNVPTTGTATVTITASPAGGGAATAVASVPLHLGLKPGQTKNFKVHFKFGTALAGANSLIVAVAQPGDTNAGNDTAVSSNTFTLV